MFLLQTILTKKEKTILNTVFNAKTLEEAAKELNIKEWKLIFKLDGIRQKLNLTDCEFSLFILKVYKLAIEQGYQFGEDK